MCSYVVDPEHCNTTKKKLVNIAILQKKIHQIPQYFNTSIPSQNFRANVAIKNLQGPGIC